MTAAPVEVLAPSVEDHGDGHVMAPSAPSGGGPGTMALVVVAVLILAAGAGAGYLYTVLVGG